MKSFLKFDKMVTPMIIQVLFWIGVAFSALGAVFYVIFGLIMMFSGEDGEGFLGFFAIIGAFIGLIVGVLFSRIYCELLIVIFKILNKLTSIDDKLSNSSNNQETL
ncbi:MAG TPA: DUF4282 domain-containing protein [Pseudogracilibacillus sp.]|nr:DUF4282 domain-containing protein [Pseudogracilibacillus sp.]